MSSFDLGDIRRQSKALQRCVDAADILRDLQACVYVDFSPEEPRLVMKSAVQASAREDLLRRFWSWGREQA